MTPDKPEPQTAAELPPDLAQASAGAEQRLLDDGLHVMTEAEKAIPTVILRNPPFPKAG